MQFFQIFAEDGSFINIPIINIIVNGESRVIIPATCGFNMTPPKLPNKAIAESIQVEDLLPTVLCFAPRRIFSNENIELRSWGGDVLPAELPQEAPEVLVYLDKPDTAFHIDLARLMDITFNAEIVEGDSVASIMERVSKTAYLSKTPSKYDWLAYAGAKVSTCQLVRAFAQKYRMAGTAAQHYFGIDINQSTLQKAAILGGEEISPKWSLETAERLFEAACQVFGVRQALQTRYIKMVVGIINLKQDVGLVILAMERLTFSERYSAAMGDPYQTTNDKLEYAKNLILESCWNILREREEAIKHTTTSAA